MERVFMYFIWKIWAFLPICCCTHTPYASGFSLHCVLLLYLRQSLGVQYSNLRNGQLTLLTLILILLDPVSANQSVNSFESFHKLDALLSPVLSHPKVIQKKLPKILVHPFDFKCQTVISSTVWCFVH